MRLVLTALHDPLGLDFDTSEPLFAELPDISTKIEPFGMTIPIQSMSLSLAYVESLANEQAQFAFIRDHASYITACKLFDNEGACAFDGAIDADEDIEFDYADKSVTFEFIGHVAAKFAEKIPDNAPAIEAYGFHYGINIYKNVIADFWRQYELPGELHFPVDAVDYYVEWARMRPLEAVCGLYGEDRFQYKFDFAGLTIGEALKRISTYGFCRILWRVEKVYFIPVSPTQTAITLGCDHIIKQENLRHYALTPAGGSITISAKQGNVRREPFEAQC